MNAPAFAPPHPQDRIDELSDIGELLSIRDRSALLPTRPPHSSKPPRPWSCGCWSMAFSHARPRASDRRRQRLQCRRSRDAGPTCGRRRRANGEPGACIPRADRPRPGHSRPPAVVGPASRPVRDARSHPSQSLASHLRGIEVYNEGLGDEAFGAAAIAGSSHAALIAKFALDRAERLTCQPCASAAAETFDVHQRASAPHSPGCTRDGAAGPRSWVSRGLRWRTRPFLFTATTRSA
jgi:hypothetical protein